MRIHIFHHWHPTGKEETRHTVSYFCNLEEDLYIEQKCCWCSKRRWIKYIFDF
jgi:hypothetical protein